MSLITMEKEENSKANVFFDKNRGGRLLTVILFLVLSVAGFAFSIYLFYISNNLYDYALAVSFLALSLVACFFNIYAAHWYYKSYFYDEYLARIKRHLKPLRTLPTVAIVMPTYNEDTGEVKSNLARLKQMDYPKNKMHFFLLDDSTDRQANAELESFCNDMQITYIHRDDRKGYKAGALNNFMRYSDDEFVAIFDADERLTNTAFLRDILPYFQNRNLSFVQTEKRYAKGTFFSDTVDIFDAFFFKFIEPARALNNTAVFAGSCGIIRKTALDRIGGFPEYVIEDTFFSFESDMHDYKSLYVPNVYALGRPILTFTSLVKQQWRYNYGDTQFISYFLKRNRGSKTKSLAHMDYITHGFGLNYISVFLILFTIVSIGIVFSNVPFIHLDILNVATFASLTNDFEIFGFLAFMLSIFTPAIISKIYFNSLRKGIMVFLLNYALAIIRTKAAIATFFKGNPGVNWNRSAGIGNRLANAVSNTKVELAFSSMLFVLGYMALLFSNIAGWIWLSWYGILYLLATVFHRKYG